MGWKMNALPSGIGEYVRVKRALGLTRQRVVERLGARRVLVPQVCVV